MDQVGACSLGGEGGGSLLTGPGPAHGRGLLTGPGPAHRAGACSLGQGGGGGGEVCSLGGGPLTMNHACTYIHTYIRTSQS